MELSLRIDVEAQKAKGELRDVEKGLDNVTESAKKTGKSMDDLKREIIPNLDEVRKRVNKLDEDFNRLNENNNRKTVPGFGALNSTLLRFAGPAAMGLALKAAADFADRLEEISVQTGMSIKALQQFDYAAKANGSSLEAVTRAANTFQDRLAGGDKSVLRALDRLGIAYDIIRNKTPDQQMLDLARAVVAIKDPAERANVAMDLFGRTGASLIPTLKALTENGGKTGVMTEETAKKVGQLSDAFVKLKDASLGLVGNVFAPLAGALAVVADLFEKASASMSGFLASATGPVGWFNDMMNQFGDPSNMPDINNTGKLDARLAIWQDFINRGKAYADDLKKAGQSPAGGLFGTDQFFGYTGEVERQINEQLKEQARLHKARGDAAEEAAKKAKKAAADELAAWNTLLANNRDLLADAQGAVGDDFNLFFGRQFTPRGGVYQDQNYWGRTDIPTIPSRDLGGVMGPITGPQSAGNVAASFQPSRRWTSQEQWNRQWMASYGDYSSWSNGLQSAGNAFSTYGQAIDDLARGDTKVLRDTNVRGRGNRAWRGALAGAQEGGQYGGPYGAAGGAVVGLLIGAFRNPAFEDIFNRIANRFGEEVSEELSHTIADIDKARDDWGREESEIYTVGSQMREIGVDDENFDKMAARVRDIFVMVDTGKFSVEEARKALDDGFSQLADHVQKSKHLASESFQELIALNKQFGIESEAVRQFVEQQTATLGGSISAMAAPLVAQYGGLSTEIERAKLAVSSLVEAGREGSSEHAKAVALLTSLQAEQAAGAVVAAAEVERLGLIATAAFNAALESGAGYLEAVEAMGPALDTLIGLQKDLGLTTENAALAELVAFRDRVNQNQELVAATEALGETMRALTSIGAMNAETLAAMEAQGLATFDKLKAAGFSENQILMMMKDYLMNVEEAHAQLGTPIEGNTAALIKQAREAGILKDKQKSATEVMTEGFEMVTVAVGSLAMALGVQVPASIQAMIDKMNQVPREFNIQANIHYNDPGWTPPRPDEQPAMTAATGGYVGAHGIQYLATGGKVLGFRPRGTDTVPAMLTPGEGILSRRGMQALGALNRGEAFGDSIVFEAGAIIVNGADDPDAVADAILRKVAQKRKLSRGRRAA